MSKEYARFKIDWTNTRGGVMHQLYSPYSENRNNPEYRDRRMAEII